MFAYFRRPHADLCAFILRMGLAFLFIGYGYLKVRQESPISEQMSLQMQQAVGWTEVVCGSLMAVGLLTRLAALVMGANMVGAIVLVTGKRELFSPSIGPHGEMFQPGYEFNILIILACLALVVLGAGWFSLDHLLFGRWSTATSAAPVTAAPPPQAPVVVSSPIQVRER